MALIATGLRIHHYDRFEKETDCPFSYFASPDAYPSNNFPTVAFRYIEEGESAPKSAGIYLATPCPAFLDLTRTKRMETMSSIKRCPRCKLVNPENGLRCDCGYDFEAQAVKGSLLSDKERRVSSTARLTTFIIDAILIQLHFLLILRSTLDLTGQSNMGFLWGSALGIRLLMSCLSI